MTCGDADRQGIKICYEVPRRGYGCRKTLQQGGDVWSQDQATCDSTAVLELRNKYFAKLKAPLRQFGDGDRRREAALAALSPQCRKQLQSLLQGAETGDREKAYSAYRSLRADCDAEIHRLAAEAYARLPECKLSSRSRGALERVVGAIAEGRTYDASYDMDEVIGFGVALITQLDGIGGIYSGVTSRQMRPSYSLGSSKTPAAATTGKSQLGLPSAPTGGGITGNLTKPSLPDSGPTQKISKPTFLK